MTTARRLLLGSGGLAATASLVRPDRVGPAEAAAFRAVNGLPDVVTAPVWLVMQVGSLAGPAVAATLARAAGRPRLAAHLLASGSSSWVLAKALKRVVRRPRPAALVVGTRIRGREQAGLGYLSGHAAVSVALARAAAPGLGPRGRALVSVVPPLVGLSRVYVGAHLPLDVLGGAALGTAVEAAVAELLGGCADERGAVRPAPRRRRRRRSGGPGRSS